MNEIMGRSNDAVYKFQHLKILQKKLHLLKMVNQKKAESMGVCVRIRMHAAKPIKEYFVL